MSHKPGKYGRHDTGWGGGDQPDSPSDQRPRRDPESSSKRLTLGLAFGRTERGLEWRDGLGCYWLVGLLVIAVSWAGLTSVGVPQDGANLMVVVALIALAAFFMAAARGAKTAMQLRQAVSSGRG
ncbi:MAG TPA: hypothetical protein VLR46_09325 [Candidatus Dormibacteraeota bacterium]|nr:hypothetical protein [Candidatus Dormibacteraeota bacterium]